MHARWAVAFAINWQRWKRSRAHRIRLVGQPIPPGVMGHFAGFEEEHRFDLEGALEEMRLAGHPVDWREGAWVARGIEEPIEFWVGAGETGKPTENFSSKILGELVLSCASAKSPLRFFSRKQGAESASPFSLRAGTSTFLTPPNL
ncbi:MAG: hypothetical protein NZM37_12540 [Sandaracinaceae bacterium]|nr:hypothetical protein [Sandaracinaceae bacterium]